MVQLRLVVNNQKDEIPSREEAYRKAIEACADYHLAHHPIRPGSKEERQWRRLWNTAMALCRPNYLTIR